MPSALTSSTLLDHIDVHDFPTMPPRTHGARPAFWRTLAQYVAWPRLQKTDRQQHLCAVSQRCETPAELFARQYPASYLLGYTGC